jgi:hypothetical protein
MDGVHAAGPRTTDEEVAVSERQVHGGKLAVADMGDAVSIEPKRVDEEGGRRALVVGYDDALAVEIEIRRGRHEAFGPGNDVREWREVRGAGRNITFGATARWSLFAIPCVTRYVCPHHARHQSFVITRRDSLEEALGEIEAERLTGASTIVVNLQWWTGLSVAEQEAYRLRTDRAHIELVADDDLSSHYVEVRGTDEGPPLSTERPV